MNDWIEWDGSNGGHPDLPLDTLVEVKFRDGEILGGIAVEYWHSECDDLNNWLHRKPPSGAEIIAYRVQR